MLSPLRGILGAEEVVVWMRCELLTRQTQSAEVCRLWAPLALGKRSGVACGRSIGSRVILDCPDLLLGHEQQELAVASQPSRGIFVEGAGLRPFAEMKRGRPVKDGLTLYPPQHLTCRSGGSPTC